MLYCVSFFFFFIFRLFHLILSAAPTLLSQSFTCSADRFCLKGSNVRAGIRKQYVLKQGYLQEVMIYSILPVETPKNLCWMIHLFHLLIKGWIDVCLNLFPLNPCCLWRSDRSCAHVLAVLCGWMSLSICCFPWLFYYSVLVGLFLWDFTIGCGCLSFWGLCAVFMFFTNPRFLQQNYFNNSLIQTQLCLFAVTHFEGGRQHWLFTPVVLKLRNTDQRRHFSFLVTCSGLLYCVCVCVYGVVSAYNLNVSSTPSWLANLIRNTFTSCYTVFRCSFCCYF